MPTGPHDPELSKQFGVLLRQQRNANGLSQEALARKVGLTKGRIQQLEAGHSGGVPTNPTLGTIAALMTALGLKPQVLLDALEQHE